MLLCSVLFLQGHAPVLNYPPQPETADMQEDVEDASVPSAPLAGEGVGQNFDGEAASQPSMVDEEDQVTLRERYKRSRPPTPVSSSSPRGGDKTSSVSDVMPHPPLGGRNRPRFFLPLHPGDVVSRLVSCVAEFFDLVLFCFVVTLISSRTQAVAGASIAVSSRGRVRIYGGA